VEKVRHAKARATVVRTPVTAGRLADMQAQALGPARTVLTLAMGQTVATAVTFRAGTDRSMAVRARNMVPGMA
jgi:hypothetical protein